MLSKDEILTRLVANDETYALVQRLIDLDIELHCDIYADAAGLDWLVLRTDTCVLCGLPNIPDGTYVNDQQHLELMTFCKDCTANELDGPESVD